MSDDQNSTPSRTAYQDSANGSIHSNSGPVASARIDDRTSLYLAIIALFVAVLALGMVIERGNASAELRASQDQAINARIEAGVAEARAQIQAQVAQTKTDSDAARINARVAVDEVERIRTGLASKGINIPKSEH